MKGKGRGIILNVLLEGIVIYGDARSLRHKAELYVREHNLQRTPAGYFHRTA